MRTLMIVAMTGALLAAAPAWAANILLVDGGAATAPAEPAAAPQPKPEDERGSMSEPAAGAVALLGGLGLIGLAARRRAAGRAVVTA